jgi:hypothetical protein
MWNVLRSWRGNVIADCAFVLLHALRESFGMIRNMTTVYRQIAIYSIDIFSCHYHPLSDSTSANPHSHTRPTPFARNRNWTDHRYLPVSTLIIRGDSPWEEPLLDLGSGLVQERERKVDLAGTQMRTPARRLQQELQEVERGKGRPRKTRLTKGTRWKSTGRKRLTLQLREGRRNPY